MKLKNIALMSAIALLAISSSQLSYSFPVNGREYSDRGDRWEGIAQTLVSNNRRLNLVSFASRRISDPGNTATIRVPIVEGNPIPRVRLQGLEERYRLDRFEMSIENSSYYSYSWSTNILRLTGTSFKNLCAIATAGSVHLPVLFESSTNEYEIVFSTPIPTQVTNLEIRRGNQTYYQTSHNAFERNKITFFWDGSDTPAGEYEIYYSALVEEQRGTPPREISGAIPFQHDPQWFYPTYQELVR
jgi:hypothetical protein